MGPGAGDPEPQTPADPGGSGPDVRSRGPADPARHGRTGVENSYEPLTALSPGPEPIPGQVGNVR
ncbi:hypothetical protein GCM10022245_77750 [Streptomyces mayteni]